jgi:hypothetical protein
MARRSIERVNWDRLKGKRLTNASGVNERNVGTRFVEERLAVHYDKKTGAPTVSGGIRVEYAPPALVPGAEPLDSFALFTFTTKMSCASFSMPAGLGKYFGTCPASDPELARKYKLDAPAIDPDTGKPYEFICSVCYAAKGRYGWAKYIHMGQEAHRIWTMKLLRKGPQEFAAAMSSAISALQRLSDLSVAKVCDPRYFRVHDSGDMFGPHYLAGWIEVAKAMPSTRFWAPTRTWIFPEVSRTIARHGGLPPNLTLRPSALFVNNPPPTLPGFSAGSMCARGIQLDPLYDKQGNLVRPPVVRLPDGVWDCPAYAGGSVEHTCIAQGCRACWDEPNRPVNYREH